MLNTVSEYLWKTVLKLHLKSYSSQVQNISQYSDVAFWKQETYVSKIKSVSLHRQYAIMEYEKNYNLTPI